LRRDVERFRPASLLAADGVDGPPVRERQNPRARLGSLRPKSSCRAPDVEKRFLDGVLRESAVPQDSQGERKCDASEPVVDLAERRFVGARDKGDDGFVGKVGVFSSQSDRGRSGERKR
jgi:hypothetical protein